MRARPLLLVSPGEKCEVREGDGEAPELVLSAASGEVAAVGVRQPCAHLEASTAPEANGTTPFLREARADDKLLLAVIKKIVSSCS